MSEARSYTWSVRRSEGGRSVASTTAPKKKKTFDVAATSAEANSLLRQAMTNERSKRWKKVIENYTHLMKILNPKNLPVDYSPIPSLSTLLYESHYHMGNALQHLGDNKGAVKQYTKAIQAVFIPKNGCRAGCNTNSCLMTPLYARRAFAQSRAGDLNSAIRDAEKAVVLDSNNPDVFCVRALVRNTQDYENLAIHDVDKALAKNSEHLCALILKGSLAQPLIIDDWNEIGIKKKISNKHHIKACQINPDCHTFLDIRDFRPAGIFTFYDRFLYSLNVPHTISSIHFPPYNSQHGRQSRPSSGKSTTESSTGTFTDSSCQHPRYSSLSFAPTQISQRTDISLKPFRAGTPVEYKDGQRSLTRRKDYSREIQEHMKRPKTAEEYIEFLANERVKLQMKGKPKVKVKLARRPTSCVSRASTAVSRVTTKATETHASKPKVFCRMNIKDAPRMYYRPWLGDKLPVADIERKNNQATPFK